MIRCGLVRIFIFLPVWSVNVGMNENKKLVSAFSGSIAKDAKKAKVTFATLRRPENAKEKLNVCSFLTANS